MAQEALLERVEQAVAAKKLSRDAADNMKPWLTESQYEEYLPNMREDIESDNWKQLDDVFYTVLEFGTGGRRGAMYPVGTNAINMRTMGESAQGLAAYTKANVPPGAKQACAIAYDTRRNSREFAELCAEVMVANGFEVYFLDGYRSTPALSFAVRHFDCACGIMITASHNPPEDNAIKAYWHGGVQLIPPHDSGVIEEVKKVVEIPRVKFSEALESGQVRYCQEEVDTGYRDAVLQQSTGGPRDLKILYSPMHGVGGSSIVPVLEGAGFKNVEVFGPHAEPNGDFPNVPEHVSNPEKRITYEAMVERAEESGADLVLSSDPDADRIGCAARLTSDGDWEMFTGNQLGALLTQFVLEERKKTGRLGSDSYVVKTLVTTDLVARIADSYHVSCSGNLLVGFKWIGDEIDQRGPEGFVIGLEESHGYLAGTYVRDKDAAIAALLLAELAARLKEEDKTLHEQLESIFWQFGAHAEGQVSQRLPGAEGMQKMKALMAKFRSDPPAKVGGMAVRQTRDYLEQVVRTPEGDRPLDGPRGNMLIFDLDREGHYVAVRPSGTEPKVKFYLFTYEPAEQIADLSDTRAELETRMERMAEDLKKVAKSV